MDRLPCMVGDGLGTACRESDPPIVIHRCPQYVYKQDHLLLHCDAHMGPPCSLVDGSAVHCLRSRSGPGQPSLCVYVVERDKAGIYH